MERCITECHNMCYIHTPEFAALSTGNVQSTVCYVTVGNYMSVCYKNYIYIIIYHHIPRLQRHWTEQSRPHVSTTSSSSLYPTHHRPEPTRFQCVQSQLSQQVSIVTCCLVYKCCALSNTMSIHVIPYKVLLCMYYMATMNLIGQLWLASYRFQPCWNSIFTHKH